MVRLESLGTEMLAPTNLQRVEGVLKKFTKRLFVAGTGSYYSPDSNWYSGEPLTKIDKDASDQPSRVFDTFYVAPRNDKFNIKHLERIRKDVVKSLAPVSTDEPLDEKHSIGLRYGYISLGDRLLDVSKNKSVRYTEIEPGSLEKLGLKIGETSQTRLDSIWRTILIKFVPHPMLAIVLRNDIPKYFSFSNTGFTRDLEHGISAAQFSKLKELVQNKYRDSNLILHDLIHEAEREKYHHDRKEIERVSYLFH